MITRENISGIINKINMQNLKNVLSETGDYIGLRVNIFNAGYTVDLDSYDYSDEILNEYQSDGNLFCPKDDFLDLINDLSEINWLTKAIINDDFHEVFVNAETLNYLINNDPTGFQYHATGTSEEIEREVGEKIKQVNEYFDELCRDYQETHIEYSSTNEVFELKKDNVFGEIGDVFLLKVYYCN
ncbi:MAG: hypothetical protein WDA08_05370 [Weeksellaceae bacterium]